jgi:hypothetical protein
MEHRNQGLIYISSLAFVIGLLAGCAGPQGDVLIRIPSIEPATNVAISELPSKTFSISQFHLPLGTGRLPGRIGERKTVGDISLGMVTIDPPPGVLLTNRISKQLQVSGHHMVDEGAEVAISGEIHSFEFHTDVTAVYWDMVVSTTTEVRLAKDSRGVTREYTEDCKRRTYIYPTGDMIRALVVQCADSMALQFANDTAMVKFLRSPVNERRSATERQIEGTSIESIAAPQPDCLTVRYVENLNKQVFDKPIAHVKGINARVFVALDPIMSAPEFDDVPYRHPEDMEIIQNQFQKLMSQGIDEVVVWKFRRSGLGVAVPFKKGCVVNGYAEPDQLQKLILMHEAFIFITQHGVDDPSVRGKLEKLLMVSRYANFPTHGKKIDSIIKKVRSLLR